MPSRREQTAGVGALAFLLLVTAAWWALALLPVPGETPEWLARTRAVCFNATESGLPDASGWLLLIGTVIFSGTVALLALGGPRWFGAITPVGGTLMIAGFVLFAWSALAGSAV